jgi:hypothetical protein
MEANNSINKIYFTLNLNSIIILDKPPFYYDKPFSICLILQFLSRYLSLCCTFYTKFCSFIGTFAITIININLRIRESCMIKRNTNCPGYHLPNHCKVSNLAKYFISSLASNRHKSYLQSYKFGS